MRAAFLILFIFQLALGKAQYTHLKESGLKGKIKSITTYTYITVAIRGESELVIDTSGNSTKNVSYYNRRGFLDSMTFSIEDQTINGKYDVIDRTVYRYKHDTLLGKDLYNSYGKLIEQWTITWLNPFRYEYRCITPIDTSFQSFKVALNTNYNVVEFHNFRLKQKDSSAIWAFSHQCRSSIDGKCRIWIVDNLKKKERSELVYNYLDLDKFKNARLVKVFNRTTKKPERLYKHIITYY